MQVVDYGPQLWFLLKDGNDYYLTVRCQQSFAEFETLLRLAPNEYSEYHALGHVYVDYLANRVSYWSSEYQNRNLHKQLGNTIHQAIMAWKAEHPEIE